MRLSGKRTAAAAAADASSDIKMTQHFITGAIMAHNCHAEDNSIAVVQPIAAAVPCSTIASAL